jgi:hypothetical protein
VRCPDGLTIVFVALLACAPAPADEELDVGAPGDEDLAAIQAWLAAGHYLEWERHDPEPAPGMVGGARVYLSPSLAASLRAGAESHPVGAAAVREIVDLDQPDAVVGWAYTHKLEAGVGAEGWLFYEVFSTAPDATPLTAERGAPGCVGCHAEGVDYVQLRL